MSLVAEPEQIANEVEAMFSEPLSMEEVSESSKAVAQQIMQRKKTMENQIQIDRNDILEPRQCPRG